MENNFQVVTLDLATVVTSVSGPKRPHDRVAVADMQTDFRACLKNKVRTKWFLLVSHLNFMTVVILCVCVGNVACRVDDGTAAVA